MATREIKAVLWDFGGVLTTSPFDAFARYETENGLDAGFLRRVNATNPDDNSWARFERSELSAEEFARHFEAEAAAAGATIDALAVMSMLSGELRPQMVLALERCHARLKTGLLTNNFVIPDRQMAPGYEEVLEHFDVILESSKIGLRKPDPRIYETACDLLGVGPGEAVFLDDLGVNLKPARAMGIHTIKVEDPDAALQELETVLGFRLR